MQNNTPTTGSLNEILSNGRCLCVLLFTLAIYCLYNITFFPIRRMKREHNKKHIEQAVIERQKVIPVWNINYGSYKGFGFEKWVN